jgi:hypothetical protein
MISRGSGKYYTLVEEKTNFWLRGEEYSIRAYDVYLYSCLGTMSSGHCSLFIMGRTHRDDKSLGIFALTLAE